MNAELIVTGIIFLAVFTQSLSGFGSALICMALLPMMISLKIATPFVALVMVAIEIFLLFYFRQAFNWKAVLPLIMAAFIGIPLGYTFLSRVDEKIVLTVLGILITGYALYALFDISLPGLLHPAWGVLFGLLAGMLGGAYNTSGPPVIVYGNSRGWQPEEFKSNLQGFFLPTSFVVALGHGWNHNLTPEVWHYFWISIPAMAAGIFLGTRLGKFINPETFRKVVLVLLVVVGVSLVIA